MNANKASETGSMQAISLGVGGGKEVPDFTQVVNWGEYFFNKFPGKLEGRDKRNGT